VEPPELGGVAVPPTVDPPAASSPDASVTFHCPPEGEFEPEALAGGCGVERWKVKTLSDAAAKGLHRQRPRSADLGDVLARQPRRLTDTSRR
jgi:hypothetical protein